MQVIRRTFEAAKFPVGSPEREQLNLCVETSEYMPSERYALKVPFKLSDGSQHPTQPFHYKTFRTKAAAVLAMETAV